MRAWEEMCQEGGAVWLDPCFHTLSSGIESMLNQAAVLGALGKNSMTTLPRAPLIVIRYLSLRLSEWMIFSQISDSWHTFSTSWYRVDSIEEERKKK